MNIHKLQHDRRRPAISTIIATIIVVAMTIVAAGVLYTYFSTTATRAQTTSQIQISAQIAVPNGSGTGIVALTVTNSGSVALDGIILSGSIVPAIVPWASGTWPIPPGQSATASFNTAISVTSGVSYAIVAEAIYNNSAMSTQIITVTAQ
jgi:flagellin-like protein